MVLDVACPLALATAVPAALGVAAGTGTLVVTAHVLQVPGNPLGTLVRLACENGVPPQMGKLAGIVLFGEVEIGLGGIIGDVAVVVHKIPGAEAAAVIGHHVLHGSGSGSPVLADELAQLRLGAKVGFGHKSFGFVITLASPSVGVGPGIVGAIGAVMEVEYRHEAHAVGLVDVHVVRVFVVLALSPCAPGIAAAGVLALVEPCGGRADGGAALRQPQQVDERCYLILVRDEAIPGGERHLPLFGIAPAGTVHGGPGVAIL